MSPGLPGLLVALAITLVASVYDIRERRIPNWLLALGLLVGVLLALATGTWRYALVGGALGFAMTLLPRLLLAASIGMGDIKLVAVVGTCLGPVALAVALMIGAVAASAVAAYRRYPCQRAPAQAVPFAPHLAVGVLMALLVQ